MKKAAAEMEPLHFGHKDKLLFGVVHTPRDTSLRATSVVMCYPLGHEYLQFHRAFRQIAVSLANSGFPTMRFDYYGTGDSYGVSNQVTVREWTENIEAAVLEMSRRVPNNTISLLGCRLGASLVAMMDANGPDVSSTLLWDPIISGAAYVAELRRNHKRKISRISSAGEVSSPADEEIIGYIYSKKFLNEIESIELSSVAPDTSHKSLVIDTSGVPSLSAWVGALTANGRNRVEYLNVPTKQIWEQGINKVTVPTGVIDAVVSWYEAWNDN